MRIPAACPHCISVALVVWLMALGAWGQTPPALEAQQAYEAFNRRDYERAAALFRQALAREPNNLSWRKELAYTLLKMGRTEEGRDAFAGVVERDAGDSRSALEYAYLCHETGQRRQARRIFHQLRNAADEAVRVAAAEALKRIDQQLEAAIARWQAAVQANDQDFSAHYELARAAFEKSEDALAAEHFRKAWQLRPDQTAILIELGHALVGAGMQQEAYAAWLAASRGKQPRAAAQARALLPDRYPYAAEFERAIALDARNIALRRELAFLYLAVGEQSKAEKVFVALLEIAPEDWVSVAQLGLLRLSWGRWDAAMPLLEKVLKNGDEQLAERVRRALEAHQASPTAQGKAPSEFKLMGDRSYEKGYLVDALRYYRAAVEASPADHEAQLKLGYTLNMLRRDEEAIRYFEAARRSPDPEIRSKADTAYRNLRPAVAPWRTTFWIFPMFSSRWGQAFTYGQLKTEFRLGRLPVRPYASVRFAGDSQRNQGRLDPQYLSEGAFVVAAGLATRSWKGVGAWFEAGNAIRYRRQPATPRMGPDYRGGAFFSRLFGPSIHSLNAGPFWETGADLVTLSRYRWDVLIYSQNRVGYQLPVLGPLHWQLVVNMNMTCDRNQEPWANFIDVGPGVRFRLKPMPAPMVWSLDYLRGSYFRRQANPFPPVYWDLRAGLWYAVTR